MRYFALLDDSTAAKETISRVLTGSLPEGWEFIECPLLPNAADYPDWLTRHSVGVLLADQRLNEEVPDGIEPVNYKGSDVLQAMRRALPDFPLVVLTAYATDDDLVANSGKADYIMSRAAFIADLDAQVERLVRRATDFLATFQAQLSDLTALAQKKAQGQTTAQEDARIAALQGLLDWPSPGSPRDNAFDEIEARLHQLETAKRRAVILLKPRKRP